MSKYALDIQEAGISFGRVPMMRESDDSDDRAENALYNERSSWRKETRNSSQRAMRCFDPIPSFDDIFAIA